MILAWVNDVWDGVRTFFTGLATTGRYFVENLRDEGGATRLVRQYPEAGVEPVGDRQRGHLYNDAARCIVCHACDRVCPVDCFKMEGERDENNKIHCSRFDIDLSKCIYCGLCVRACPTDSLSMTAAFELDAARDGVPFLFTRNSAQLDVRLEEDDVERLRRLSVQPRDSLSAEERTWLDARVATDGRHLIGIYGLGYYSPAEKARVDAEREARRRAKDAVTRTATVATPPIPPGATAT